MASITFTDQVTVVPAAWLNDVNTVVWSVFNGATTVALARTALGLGTADNVTFGRLLVGDGSAAAPSLAFTNNTDTGLALQPSTGQINIYSDATPVVCFQAGVNQAGLRIVSPAALTFSSGVAVVSDIFLHRDAAATLAQRNGTNAQQFRIYTTYTDASNYERIVIGSGVFGASSLGITTDSLGTGSARNLIVGSVNNASLVVTTNNTSRLAINGAGNMVWTTDNTLDIGALGANRPRTMHLGTQLVTPSVHIGSGTPDSAYTFRISAATPRIFLNESDQGVDEKNWALGVGSKNLSLLTFNDGDSTTGGGFTMFRGTGTVVDSIRFFSAASTEQFRINHVASAVNYLQAQGGATATGVILSAQGSDTNISTNFYAKGSGALGFYTNNGAQLQAAVLHNASAVNYLTFNGAATAGQPFVAVAGTDTDIGLSLVSKGTGGIRFITNSGSQLQAFVSHVASAVNFLQFQGAVTAGNPIISAQGSDTNVGLEYRAKGAAGHLFETAGSSGTPQFAISHTASAVNYIQATGSVTADSPTLTAQGSDTNIAFKYGTKGTGGHLFYTNGISRPALVIADTGVTNVNYWSLNGNSTGNSPTFRATGTDTNVSATFATKGSGAIDFRTNFEGTNDLQVRVLAAATAVNYLQLTGAVTTAGPQVAVAGSDTNIALNLSSKGNSAISFYTNGMVSSQVNILHTASANRQVTLTGSNGGNPTVTATAGALQLGSSSIDVVVPGSMMQQNSQSTNYTAVAADANKHILHPTADNNPRTFTIPANASVAYAIGTMITFVNQINTVTIAITSDTMTLAGAGTTGSRTLAANGVATALKIASTSWIISGTGLT